MDLEALRKHPNFYYGTENGVLLHGDCLDIVPDLSGITACVTDPPYGLNFMGKGWDHGVPGVEYWDAVMASCLPGAPLMAFGGTRTVHRLVCAIEDAGWEIRDQLMWLYGSGMPKSFNMKRVDKCSCIPSGNAVPYNKFKECDGGVYGNSRMRDVRQDVSEIPISCSQSKGTILFDAMQRKKACGESKKVQREYEGPQTEGRSFRRKEPVLEGRSVCGAGEGLRDDSQCKSSEGTAERLCAGTHSDSGTNDRETIDKNRRGPSCKPQQGGQQTGKLGDIYKPQGSLDEKTLQGRGSCERCGKLTRAWDGHGTALKPSFEPICFAMKPIEGTFANNAIKYGVAGINVDGGRVGTDENLNGGFYRDVPDEYQAVCYGKHKRGGQFKQPSGRWPANVIHDGSPEVVGLFPDTNPSTRSERGKGIDGATFKNRNGNLTGTRGHDDLGGSAARFFYCAKASREERNRGCGDLVEKDTYRYGDFAGTLEHAPKINVKNKNSHATVKPLALIKYLITLVTMPEKNLILDPFLGSGTTAIACEFLGLNWIACEKEEESCEIAARRIENEASQRKLF